MPAPAPPVQRIDYAPPPPWRKRRAFRRVVQGVVLLGALGVAVYFAPAVWHRVMLLHAQRQCLSYTGSPEKVVYEADPERAAALMATDPQYVALRPEEYPVAWFSKDWDRLSTLLSPPGRKQAATVFMGELRTPKGARRLVVVNVNFSGGFTRILEKDSPTFHISVVETGTLFSPPRLSDPLMLTKRVPVMIMKHAELRLFAGQADPEDHSHFTIKYELDDVSGTIDGWLRGDESVVLEERDGFPPLGL